MTKKKKSKLTIEELEFLYTRNLDVKNRTIFFMPWQPNDEVMNEEWMVHDFSTQNIIKGLHVLNRRSKSPIKVIWVSYGGMWSSGMAIYDTIKNTKSPVEMYCYGRVRSMGTVILQACKKRLLSSNCEFLIHYGESSFEGTSQDAIISIKEEEKNNKKMEDIYLDSIREKHPRFTREKLQALMPHDKYMSPQEAVDLGLADKVI